MSDLMRIMKTSSASCVQIPAQTPSSLASASMSSVSMPTAATKKDTFVNSMKDRYNKASTKQVVLISGALLTAAALIIGLKLAPSRAERTFKTIAADKIKHLKRILGETDVALYELNLKKRVSAKTIIDPIVMENRLIKSFERKIEKMDLHNSPEEAKKALAFFNEHKEKAGTAELYSKLDDVYSATISKIKELGDKSWDMTLEPSILEIPPSLKDSKVAKQIFENYKSESALFLDEIEKSVSTAQCDNMFEKSKERIKFLKLITENQAFLRKLKSHIPKVD